LVAVSLNSGGSVFGGFLINPVDGHSYLAKMQQGFQGNWRFELPYTARAGSGAYLFLFYLGLGHLGRIFGMPLVLVFHIFRVLGAVFLVRVLYQFNTRLFENKRYQNTGFAVSVLGSGLGWTAVLVGMFTSDFWVAEAYPFLSMYTNPHFTIGLALMIMALMPDRKTSLPVDMALGVILGIIQPFAVVIVLVVRAGCLVMQMIDRKAPGKRLLDSRVLFPIIAFALGGGSVLLYQYWSILADPVLSMWNAQNITQSPGFLDLAISLSPAIILAVLGAKAAWKDNQGKKLVIWAGTSLFLALIPWNLQRRFLTGIYVPIAGISIFGLIEIERMKEILFKKTVVALLVLSIPTNLIVIASGIQAAVKLDPQIYQEEFIYSALDWIGDHAAEDAVILADEEMGLLIPSRTGRNVIYGHPFETVNAGQEIEFVREFFENDQEDHFYNQNILNREVDYIFLNGEGSPNLERWISGTGFELEYKNEAVRIFRIGQ
jgi:hypothetical protein